MRLKYLILIFFIVTVYTNILAQNYASMYIANGSTDLITGDDLTADTWLQVSGLTAMENSGNWTFSSDAITPNSSAIGDYFVRYSLSFTATTGAIITVSVMVNDTEQSELTMVRKIGTNTDVGNVAGTGFITISSTSDVVTFKVKSDISTDEFTPMHAQVVLVELDESATPKYAEMLIDNNSTEQVLTDGYTTLNNYSTGNNILGWTFNSNKLTASVGSAGKYLVVYSMSFEGNGPIHYDFGMAKNTSSSSNIPDQILLKRTISTTGSNNDIGNVVATGILDVAEGDIITAMGNAGATKTITAIYSNVSLIKIAESDNGNEYANMNITDNSSSTAISTMGLWYQVTNFVSGFAPSGWTFNSTNKTLQAGANAPGVYLVNYCIGVSLETEKDVVYPLVTISVNGGEQSNLINKRLLPRTVSDVGSISGNGIVSVENIGDEISLEIQNTSDATNFIVKHSNVDLFRIGDLPEPVPVELTSFNANVHDNSVAVSWQTATEVNNYGFQVERKKEKVESDWETIGFVEGHGNSNSVKSYSFADTDNLCGTIQYRLKQIDIDGAFEYSEAIEVEFEVPAEYKLVQNYPNPFNPSTTIQFAIPKTGIVSLKIYNILGEEVAELVNREMNAGFQKINFDASHLSSGLYLYRISAGEFVDVKKMMLLK